MERRKPKRGIQEMDETPAAKRLRNEIDFTSVLIDPAHHRVSQINRLFFGGAPVEMVFIRYCRNQSSQ